MATLEETEFSGYLFRAPVPSLLYLFLGLGFVRRLLPQTFTFPEQFA